MKQIIKKVLSIYMISTLVLSMLLSSLQRVSADESENIPNSPIKVLEAADLGAHLHRAGHCGRTDP